MIERTTKAGTHISSDAMAQIFYPRADWQQGRNAVKATVHQINSLLKETDLIICCERGEGYWLGKRPS
jgi:DNA-binding SARP family transcriptional activator